MEDKNHISLELESAYTYLRWQYFWVFISGLMLLALTVYVFVLAESEDAISSQFLLLMGKYGLLGVILAVLHMIVLIVRLPGNVTMYASRWRTGKSISVLIQELKSFFTLRELRKALLYWAIGLGVVVIPFAKRQFLFIFAATGPAFCITTSFIWFAYRLSQQKRKRET